MERALFSVLGAAIAGAIAAIGLFVYEQIQKQERQTVNANLSKMESELKKTKDKLDRLVEENRKKSAKKKKARCSSRTNSVMSISTMSIYNSDSSDTEFFDAGDNDEAEELESLKNILSEVDILLKSNILWQLESVLEKLKDLLKDYPDSIDILWRIGKAHYEISCQIENESSIKDHIKQGIDNCDIALKIDPEHAEAHKWFAILVGSRSEKFGTVKEKIADGALFKTHVDAALKTNPSDSTLHYMLGRFSYEVASLSWIERQVASACGLPSATYADSLKHLMEADRLADCNWKEYKLMIAKCNIAINEYKEAVKWLDKARSCEHAIESNSNIDDEIVKLLNNYKSFR